MSTDRERQQLRLTVASLLHRGVRHEDILADVVAAARGVSSPGAREVADGLEVAQVWADIEAYAEFETSQGSPPRE